MLLGPRGISSPHTFNHRLELCQKWTVWRRASPGNSWFSSPLGWIYTATNPALPFLWRKKSGGRERLTRIRSGRERLYQDSYINQPILPPLKHFFTFYENNSASVPSAGSWSLYVKMTRAYGWEEHNKGLHPVTTRGFHIFWALCYPSGQQKANFRSQRILRETKTCKE